MKLIVVVVLLIALAGCQAEEPVNKEMLVTAQAPIINREGTTIQTRFQPPAGYTRIPLPASAFGSFLRQCPLQPDGAEVHYFNGQVKANPGIYAAVLTYDVGTKDLQQCADAVMRLRAEYLFSIHQPEKIHFHLTSGFNADFTHWSQGYRMVVRGSSVSWVKSAPPAADHAALREYLDAVYVYAGTLSLSKELQPVAWKDMQPGDVLIVGGSPGHAVTVMDMAADRNGKKVFMLSQSYMPAQEIQILQNPHRSAISPWYELDAAQVITPQWNFTTGQLRRFSDGS